MARTGEPSDRSIPWYRRTTGVADRVISGAHPTLRYGLLRLVAAVGLLFVSSVVVFVLQHLAPGSPEAILLGGRPATPELLAQIRTQYRLDDPLWMQYWTWL
ncbi:MAG: hypothetical protein ACK5MP_12640, partial [Nostocoides sp.]